MEAARIIVSAIGKQKERVSGQDWAKMHRPGIEPGAGRIIYDH
jgi:hypothetical protein